MRGPKRPTLRDTLRIRQNSPMDLSASGMLVRKMNTTVTTLTSLTTTVTANNRAQALHR